MQRETLPEVLKLLLESKCFCRTATAATKLPSTQKAASSCKEARENMASGCSNLKKTELSYAVPKMLLMLPNSGLAEAADKN